MVFSSRELVKKSREQELLARIAMEPFVSTKKLCAEFGVSRQALHPFLKTLAEQKRIRVVRRGPVSGYVAID
jgi:DeoR/GlpR family transcriptional regulator of sugar metabolism